MDLSGVVLTMHCVVAVLSVGERVAMVVGSLTLDAAVDCVPLDEEFHSVGILGRSA